MADINQHQQTAAARDQVYRAPQLLTENAFRLLFEKSPDAILLLDGGVFADCNQAAVEMLRYSSKSELLSTAPSKLSPPFQPDGLPSSEKANEMIARAIERGSHRFEWMGKRSDESEFPIEVLLTAIPVEDRHVLHTVWRDISRRKGAELDRSRAEEQVSLLQAITLEVVVAQDLSSALEVVLRRVCEKTGWVLGQSWVPRQDGTLLECSPAWFTSADGLEEFRLGSLNSRFPPGVGLPGRAWQLKQAVWVRDVTFDTNFPRGVLARESGLKAALALPILSGDEVIAVIEFFMREPQDEDERLVKVISAVAAQLDLAIERKRAEEQLRRTQAELAHVSRVTTMGELAASIAHEVNQPLGAIVGNADICLQWLGDVQPDLAQLRDAIADIASDGRRASEVIARIRSLVKKHAPEKAPLDLCGVAREVLYLIEHEAHRKQIALRCELEAGPAMVNGDRVQLQQVLLNLVMNGIEAMTNLKERRPGLTVRIWKSESGEVLTAVRDCGVGIKPEDAEQLFKPFHTTKSAGMGMGLAISRSIVEAHGGRLWHEPTQGPGAMFKFTLPAGGEGGP